MSEYCTRSHPHENMDCCCQHLTVIARAKNEIEALRARVAELQSIVERASTTLYVAEDAVEELMEILPNPFTEGDGLGAEEE